MSIRLLKARPGARKKIFTSALAVTVLAGAVSAVLAATARPASADIKDFTPANWNMQGAQNTLDNKWNTGVRSLINSNHNVIALQEAGAVPATAGQPVGTQQFNVDTPVQGGGTATVFYDVHHYVWNLGTTRRREDWHIYWVQTDRGGNRVNLAVVTRNAADRVLIAAPAFLGARPALGVMFGDPQDDDADHDYFWSVHAMSGTSQGGDSHQLIDNIEHESNGVTNAGDNYYGNWAAMGDWNREPAQQRRYRNGNQLPANLRIYAAGRPTHMAGQAARGNAQPQDRELDYMITNEVIPTYAPGTSQLGGDHHAVFYYPLRANADVQIMTPSNNNSEIGVSDNIVPNPVFALTPDTADWKDTTWTVVPDWWPGWFNIKSKLTGGCWDATDTKLTVRPCNNSNAQRMGIEYWGDSGQPRIRSLSRSGTCIGEDPNDSGLGSPILTTVNCKKGGGPVQFPVRPRPRSQWVRRIQRWLGL